MKELHGVVYQSEIDIYCRFEINETCLDYLYSGCATLLEVIRYRFAGKIYLSMLKKFSTTDITECSKINTKSKVATLTQDASL